MKLFTIIFVISVVGFTATQDIPLSQEINSQIQSMPMMLGVDSLFPNVIMNTAGSFDSLLMAAQQTDDGIVAEIQSQNSYKDYCKTIQDAIDAGKKAVNDALANYITKVLSSSSQIDAAYTNAVNTLTLKGCGSIVPTFRMQVQQRITDFSMSFGKVRGCIPDGMLQGVYSALSNALWTPVDGISRLDAYKLAQTASLGQVSDFYLGAANYTATYLLQLLDGASVDKIIADVASQAQEATCP